MAAELAASLHPRRAFQDIFAEAMKRWIGGGHDAEYPESWPAFCARCEGAAQQLPATLGRSKTALVFTSGGPITAIVRQLLGLSDERAIRRSEEHTSELQSLMRISYAVFRLQKKHI